MSAVATKPNYTVDEFLALPDHDDYELVDGELVEVNASNLSSWVANQTAYCLSGHCKGKQIGEIFNSEAIFQMFSHRPRNTRKPDVSFICRERLPEDWAADNYFTIRPDRAVEVLSPNDLAYKVDAKIREYLDAGVKLIWVINPEQRVVQVYRADGTVSRLLETDSLSGEDVVPGFSCRASELFPPLAESKESRET